MIKRLKQNFKHSMIYVVICAMITVQMPYGYAHEDTKMMRPGRSTIAAFHAAEIIIDSFVTSDEQAEGLNYYGEMPVVDSAEEDSVQAHTRSRRATWIPAVLRIYRTTRAYVEYIRKKPRVKRFLMRYGTIIFIVSALIKIKLLIRVTMSFFSADTIADLHPIRQSLDSNTGTYWTHQPDAILEMTRSHRVLLDTLQAHQIWQELGFGFTRDSLQMVFIDTIQFIAEDDFHIIPERIAVSNSYDYDVLDSLAKGTRITTILWQDIARTSIAWYEERGGRKAFAREEMGRILRKVPQEEKWYSEMSNGKRIWKSYLQPDTEGLAQLADSLPPIPGDTVPLRSVDDAIAEMQSYVADAIAHDTAVYEKDLVPSMTQIVAYYLKKAAPDLEIIIVPPTYISEVYDSAHAEHFSVEWLNAQRHPLIDQTTVYTQIHFDSDDGSLGAMAYPRVLTQELTKHGYPRYSNLLWYERVALIETMGLNQLIRETPDLMQIHLAKGIDECVETFRRTFPGVKRIALAYGHGGDMYRRRASQKPSVGFSKTYDSTETGFISDTTITWSQKVAMDEAAERWHNRVEKKWLRNKKILIGAKIKRLSRFTHQLQDIGVYEKEGDAKYVYFSEETQRGSKYDLYEKMRLLGWSPEVDSVYSEAWVWTEIAFRKRCVKPLFERDVRRFGLEDIVARVETPVWPDKDEKLEMRSGKLAEQIPLEAA